MFEGIKGQYLKALLETAGADSIDDMILPRDDDSPYLLRNPKEMAGLLSRDELRDVPPELYAWPESETAPRRIDCIYSLLGLQLPSIEGVLYEISQGRMLEPIAALHWEKICNGAEEGLEKLLKPKDLSRVRGLTPEVRAMYKTLYERVTAAVSVLSDDSKHRDYMQIRMAAPRRLIQLYRPMLGGEFELEKVPEPLDIDLELPKKKKKEEMKFAAMIVGGSIGAFALFNYDLTMNLVAGANHGMGALQNAAYTAAVEAGGLFMHGFDFLRFSAPIVAGYIGLKRLASAAMLPGGRLQLTDSVEIAPLFNGEVIEIDEAKLRTETQRHRASIGDRHLQMREQGLQISSVKDRRSLPDRRAPQLTDDAGKEAHPKDDAQPDNPPTVLAEDDTFLQNSPAEGSGEQS